ncbi:MAG: DeoR/GlpR family DNA-binding transcription regulator [Treponema sp.]|nr:DeoR/GlpR family DNA-binding transcription regulator [Treponema sp.]
MYQDLRREKILELIKENGSCSVQTLSKMFEVSQPTIRKDLEALELAGSIKRQHGGAFVNNYSSFAADLQLSHKDHMEEKHRIGLRASQFIESGDSIILDSGSTITELAKCISDKKDLNIVTNAINITLLLGKEPSNKILIPGGEFKAPTLSITGDRATSIFENLYVNKLFLAAGGFSLEAGLTYPGFSDIALKRAMINSAKTIYLLCDSSKLKKILFASLGCQEKINYLITDSGVDPEFVTQAEKLGIQVVIS